MNKLVVSKKDTRIAPWGDRNDVREIANRIKLMVPGGKKLSETEALALAQGAVAHNLDPFNGEIWYIPGSGLMAGIKGLRKAARQQIEGNFWTEFHEITDPDERSLFIIPDGALAFKCIVRDSNTIRAYSEAWKELSQNGVPIEMIPDVIGKRPFTMGIGYIKEGEKTKMDPIQVAMKRSEADALKRRFDLPFAIPLEPSDNIIVDGEWAEALQDSNEENAHEGSAALFGDESTSEVIDNSKRPYSAEKIRAHLQEAATFFTSEVAKGNYGEVADQTQKYQGLVAANMEKCFAGDKDATEKRHSVLMYIWGIDSTKKLTAGQILAHRKHLNWTQDSGGDWNPDDLAVKEVRAMYKARLKELGQEELPIEE